MALANKITLARIFAVPLFVIFLMYYKPEAEYFRYIALAIFITAIISDAVDGFIARNRGQCSELGAYLDPIADKLLLIVAFISLSVMGNLPPQMSIPAWTTLLVITRDGVILLGAGLIYILKGDLKIKPSILGKITTFSQMFFIFYVLAGFPYRDIVLYSAMFFTFISGVDYIRKGSALLGNNYSPN